MAWYDDAPRIDVWCERRIKHARKQHKCDLCKKNIEIGQAYKRTVSVEDGQFQVYKVHIFLVECYKNK